MARRKSIFSQSVLINMDPRSYKQLKIYAVHKDTSMSEVVRKLVDDEMKKHFKPKKSSISEE